MSLTTWWFGRAAGACGVVVVLCSLYTLLGEPDSPSRRALRGHMDRLNRTLGFLRARVRAVHIVAGQALLGGCCTVAAALGGHWTLVLSLPVIVAGPSVYCNKLAATRTTRIEELIEPWLNAIANSLKASPSLREGIASSLPLIRRPLSEEIDVVLKENDLGAPLDLALDDMVRRVQSRTLAGAVLALKVARRSGGNLPEMLESAARGLREMARLEGVVRTKTAEGKAQTVVISLLPFPMIAGIHWMDPDFFAPLAHSFAGHLLVGGAAVLWMLAIMVARKILDVDI